MTHKITAALLCVIMLLGFAGCQLALPNAGSANGRLIGLYVTTEHVDLFDSDAYASAAFGKMRGGDIVMPGDITKYQGRLYATLTRKTLVDELTGHTTEIGEFVFEGIPGVAFFAATIPATDGRDSYISSVSNPGIVGGILHLSYGDDEDSMTFEGTIYVTPALEERTFYFNPVFQSSDGSVYLSTGHGYMIGAWSCSEGVQITQTLSESTSVTEGGKSKTKSISAAMTLSVMYAPLKISVLQMDEGGLLLSRTEYTPGLLPAELVPSPGTAFIVVETHKQNTEGAPVVVREICNPDSTGFDTFSATEEGFCIQNRTQILWDPQAATP